MNSLNNINNNTYYAVDKQPENRVRYNRVLQYIFKAMGAAFFRIFFLLQKPAGIISLQ